MILQREKQHRADGPGRLEFLDAGPPDPAGAIPGFELQRVGLQGEGFRQHADHRLAQLPVRKNRVRQIVHRRAHDLAVHHIEIGLKSGIAGNDPEFGIEHQQRFADRVDDRFRIGPCRRRLQLRLFQAGDVGERDHGAQHMAGSDAIRLHHAEVP